MQAPNQEVRRKDSLPSTLSGPPQMAFVACASVPAAQQHARGCSLLCTARQANLLCMASRR